MIPEASGLSQARPPARLFRVWTQWALVLALLPVVRIWQLTGSADATVTTVALFLGAGWQMGRLLPQVQQRPHPLTRGWALIVLTLGLWQIAWIGINDFWFVRGALIICAVTWLLLAWGLAGLIWGWRILAAFILWAALCDGPWQWFRDGYQTGDALGPKLASLTAQIAGGLMAQAGAAVIVDHDRIQLGGQVVSVGVPCTALPLAKLLLLLLILAILLFRLELWAAFRLGVIALAASFLISIGRVMLLAYVVRDPPRFHYWHDADQAGGSWFTAAGMLIMAFLIARQIFRQRVHEVEPVASVSPPSAPPLRWLLAASLISWGASAWLSPLPPARFIPPEQISGISLTADAIRANPLGAVGHAAPDQPASIRQITYASSGEMGRLDLIIAYIPQTLTGAPLAHPLLNAQIPVAGTWSLSPDSRYAWCRSRNGMAWVTTVASDGELIATEKAWDEHLRRIAGTPSRWLAWLMHRMPLRDKRSYWVGAYASRPLPSHVPPKLFMDCIAVLTKSN